MESKIAGYKLVPEIKNCSGCSFENVRDNGISNCMICTKDFLINDCIKYNAIYVPSDTAIEVPKINQLENEQ